MATIKPRLLVQSSNKIIEAKEILKALGLPKQQQNERSALVLLALSGLRNSDKWSNAKARSMSVVGNKENGKYPGIMRFIAEHYKKLYAENSRETLRRQTLHQFVQAGLVEYNPENPKTSTNSKNNHYRLSPEALEVISAFKSKSWKKKLSKFESIHGKLQEKYASKRSLTLIPLTLKDGKVIKFSAGRHNSLQISIIKEFAPRFAPGSLLLYVGDTANKSLFKDAQEFERLKIPYDEHAKLPDVMIYDPNRNWLYLVEAVTSHGPISPKRIIELEQFLKNCKAGKIYVSAFPDFKEFKRHSTDIAWETEVWIAIEEMFDHMIHFNGDKFIGPRK